MKPEEKMKYQGRLLLFYGLLIIMVGTLLGGVGYRQLFESDQSSERVKRQNQRRIITPAPRGHIYDREGRLLVSNKSKFTAVVFLSDTSVRAAFRREYRELVRDHRERGEDYNTTVLARISKANVIQRYLDNINDMLGRDEKVDARKIAKHFYINPLLPYPILDDLSREEFAILLESLPVESPVQVYATNTRHYPYEATASHTLGYVTSTYLTPSDELPGEDLRTFAEKGTFGRSGVERQYDNRLQGEMGLEIWRIDIDGYQVENIERRYPLKGSDIQLSLDIDLQLAAEKAFKDKVGGLVAIDIETLEILAMVSKPDYDLNDTAPYISNATFQRINETGGWQNRAIQGLYPPGSPFKLLTAIAALKTGTMTPEDVHDCKGHIIVSRSVKPCWKDSGHGERSLEAAIRDSCNVYFYEVALDTGVDIISREAIYMGLANKTNIDLPHETGRMLVPTRSWKKERVGASWYPGDTTNLAIGQGFLRLTPMQMALFTTSVVRNEVVSNPSILKLSKEQIASRPPPKPLGLSESDHKAVLNGMFACIEIGTGRRARIPGIAMGGKTGTAQVRKLKEAGTIELAWFISFAPVHDPKIAIATLVEGQEIDIDFGGSVHAAPISHAVLNKFFEKNPDYLPPSLESVQ